MIEEASTDMAPTRIIRKFNPGTFQSDEEVIRQFVVRERELEIVLEVLWGNIETPSCQHVLLVAPRGRGKTMLLARVAAEMRSGDELSRRLLPVRFMEESHEIFDIADFWLETLFYLSKEIIRPDPDLARELQAVHADLTGQWRGEFLAERARATVLDASDRLGRKLVLMVENLQALCDDVNDDFGWQLRETLQNEPQIILLGTATSRFERLDDVSEPFFKLFRILDLKPLDTDDCRRLWQVVSGDDVSERRIRPLQILTGGNPRLLVIVAEFGRHRSLDLLMEELVSLVDDHTEYFRGHLEVLAPTERRVYLAVIDLWKPSNTGEIAARARMDVRIVSSLLGRLVDRGAVVIEGQGRKRSYAAAERLYCIYYKLRRERDEAAVVHNLIRSMKSFYVDDEFTEMAGTIFAEVATWPTIRKSQERDEADWPQEEELFDMLGPPESESQSDGDTAGAAGTRDAEIQVVIDLMNEGTEHLRRKTYQAVHKTCDTVIERFEHKKAPKIRFQVAKAMALKGVMLALRRDLEAAITTFGELIKRHATDNAKPVQMLVTHALAGKAMAQFQSDAYEEMLGTYDEMMKRPGIRKLPNLSVVQGMVVEKIFERGLAQQADREFGASIETFDGLIRRFGASENPQPKILAARAMLLKGFACHNLGDFGAELAACDELVEGFGGENEPDLERCVIGALYAMAERQSMAGRADEALSTCDEIERRLNALQCGDNVATSWMERPAKGLRGHGQKSDVKPIAMRWMTKWIRMRALLNLNELRAAMDVFRSAYAEFDPEDEMMMRTVSRNLVTMISSGASVREMVAVLLNDSGKAESLAPFHVAIRRLMGETVRAPAEVLEVADDVMRKIVERKESR